MIKKISKFLRTILNFLRRNYKTIDKWSTVIFNILISINLFIVLYAIWSINTNGSTNPSSTFILLGIQLFISIVIIIFVIYNWSRKDAQSKLNRNLLISVSFIIVFSIPITYFILYIGRSLSVNDGVQIGSADGWLSFIGSLFGGLITMVAVIFTINHERNIRKEEYNIQMNRQINELMPIIDFNFKVDENGDVLQDTHSILISQIINQSNSHAILNNVYVSKFTYDFKSEELAKHYKDKKNIEVHIFSFKDQVLAGKSTKDYLLTIPILTEMMVHLAKDSSNSIDVTFSIIINFSDIQELQKYKLVITRQLKVYAEYKKNKINVYFKLEKLQINDKVTKI